MKTIKILSAIILISTFGFAQTDNDSKANKKLNRKVSTKTYTDNTYSPTETVEIYKTNKPERSYIEIAQLETSASRRDAVELFTTKAKQLGGDAIIMVGEEYKGEYSVPLRDINGNVIYSVSAPITSLIGIVIKFKK